MLIMFAVSMCHFFDQICVFSLTESGWKAQYERTRDHCIHGLGCKTGSSCKSKSSPVLAFSLSRNAVERESLSPDVV